MKKIFLITVLLSFVYSNSETLENLENLYYNGEFLEALNILENNKLDNEEYYYLGYLVTYKLDDLNKANQYLQEAIKSDEDDEERYTNAADLLSELINDLKNTNKTLTSGFINEAILELQKLIKKYPDNSIVYYRLGYAYKSNDDLDNAAINIKKAIELNPFKEDYKTELTAIANIEIIKGKEFYDIKEYQEALIHFNKALEYDPENSSAMFRLGNIYYAIRDYSLSAEFLEKGLSFNPSNYKVWYMLGRCYTAVSENEKALNAYTQSLDLKPTFTKSSFEIAKIYKSSGQLTESKQILNDIINQSNDSKAYELLLDIEISTGNLTEAQSIGEMGLQNNTDSYTLLARMSALYNETANHDSAKKTAKESLKLKRNYAPAAFELGIAEISLCNKVAAKEAFSIAKRDRNYRKAASSYLKPENFDHYTNHCN